LVFGFVSLSPLALCPWLGGTEELSGVLRGFLNSASNASTRFVSTSICFVSASISAINSSFENEARMSRFIESLNRGHRHPSTTFCAQPTLAHQTCCPTSVSNYER
jgi:hypothetical protein